MGEIAAVYAAGLLQGLALVTFPAASAVLTSPTRLRAVHRANTARCSRPRPSWRWPPRCWAPGWARAGGRSASSSSASPRTCRRWRCWSRAGSSWGRTRRRSRCCSAPPRAWGSASASRSRPSTCSRHRCSRAVSTWRCSRSTPCSVSERRWRRRWSRCSWRSASGGGCRSRSACCCWRSSSGACPCRSWPAAQRRRTSSARGASGCSPRLRSATASSRR